MIIGLVGNLGRGKTLGMTMLGHYLYYETQYDNVVTNYRTDLTTDYIENPVEFDDISQNTEGIYLLDEIWAWADSRKSQENDLMNEVVINSRKRGCLVIYTVQSLDMVDKRLRNNTDYFGICRHYEDVEVGRTHDVAQILLFDDEGLPVNKFTYNAETYYGTYDTDEEVATKSSTNMYSEHLDEAVEGFKAEKFENKKEVKSYLRLEHDLSKSKADDIATEAFRRYRNEEQVKAGNSGDDGDFNPSNSNQEALSDAIEG